MSSSLTVHFVHICVQRIWNACASPDFNQAGRLRADMRVYYVAGSTQLRALSILLHGTTTRGTSDVVYKSSSRRLLVQGFDAVHILWAVPGVCFAEHPDGTDHGVRCEHERAKTLNSKDI